MKKSRFIGIAGVVLVIFVVLMGLNFVIPLPDNPPQRHTGTILSEAGDGVLRRACFDCHSNETVYPWYAHMPGIGAILANHIREGREKLNFSMWDSMSPSQRRENIAESLESLRKGAMPPTGYTLLHPDARLDPTEITLLEQAASQTYGPGVLKESEQGGDRKGGRHGEEDDDDEEKDHD